MIFNRLSLLFFALAFVSMALIFGRVTPFGLNLQSVLRYGVIAPGMLGFAMSILSILFDKNRKSNKYVERGVVFYIGASFMMLGVLFQVLHYPYSTILIVGGLIISGGGMVIQKNKTRKKNEDLLDD